jgi:hypothetical protein
MSLNGPSQWCSAEDRMLVSHNGIVDPSTDKGKLILHTLRRKLDHR